MKSVRERSSIPPEANRIISIKNLPFDITDEKLYETFGRYGSIRQIRKGTDTDTRGSAFVVYDDIYDAKDAVESLNGFKISDRYITVFYHEQSRLQSKIEVSSRQQYIERLKKKHGLDI